MKSFTLVEILVTISIMVVISTIVVLNINHYQPKTKVDSAAQEFYSQLLYARNLAVSGTVFKDQLGDGKEVPNGYGVYFESAAIGYWIFGDLYDPPDGNEGDKKYDDLSEKTNLGDVAIDDKIGVELIDEDPNKTIEFPLHIFFETPNGKMYYYNHYDTGENYDVFDTIQVKFFYKDDAAVNQTVVVKRTFNQIYIAE